MRTLTLALVAATLCGTTVLAQAPSDFVGASDRIVPLAGTHDVDAVDRQSAYGVYRDAEGRIDVEDTGSVRGGSFNSNREAVFEDSAKGGNAEQNQRSYPNLGTTSGGPEF